MPLLGAVFLVGRGFFFPIRFTDGVEIRVHDVQNPIPVDQLAEAFKVAEELSLLLTLPRPVNVADHD